MSKENENLTKKSKDLLDKLNNQSLDKVNTLRNKIERMNKYKNTTLLCDVSGSMSLEIQAENKEYPHKRAIDLLNEVLINFKGANIYEFSTYTYKVRKLSEPNGETNMARAFETIKSAGIKETILLTDGLPDSPAAALEAAKGLIINIIYIGPQPTPEFLKVLAAQSGAKFTSVKLIRQGAELLLENKIKGFITGEV